MNASRTDDPLKIGLTGGIASGKSTVANLFADLGVPVIDTDVIARDLVEPGQPALDEIRRQFGDALIDETGHLDRVAMRKLIFADDEARSSLEAILHPRIGAEARRQSKEANGPYQIIVIPLLVQSPLLEFIDRVLVVDCDVEVQIQRLRERDGETEDQARRILAAQATREERLAIADDVIVNNDTLASTRAAVSQLNCQYRRLAAQPGPS